MRREENLLAFLRELQADVMDEDDSNSSEIISQNVFSPSKSVPKFDKTESHSIRSPSNLVKRR